MRGSQIIVASNPRGVFLEGVIATASKPGTCMQIQAGTALINSQPTWEPYEAVSGADGDPRLVVVLKEDALQGFLPTSGAVGSNLTGTAYVVGAQCFLYVPYPGEWINVIFASQQGTGSADVVKIGERFMIQHATGKLIVQNTSSGNAPFQCMEYINGPADTDILVWCIRT